VPESRQAEGLFFNLDVPANVTIAALRRVTADDLIVRSREMQAFADISARLSLAAALSRRAVGELSGGNQQKLILGRWLFCGSKLLLLDEPTRGVDLGTRLAIYDTLRELVASGLSVLLVSSDWEELLHLSNNIAPMRSGCLETPRGAGCFEVDGLSLTLADPQQERRA
jgi:ABC-type sugar transport system ATPase subunit